MRGASTFPNRARTGALANRARILQERAKKFAGGVHGMGSDLRMHVTVYLLPTMDPPSILNSSGELYLPMLPFWGVRSKPPNNLFHGTIGTLAGSVAGISSLLVCLNQCQASIVPETPTSAIESGPVQTWVSATIRDFFRVEG